jgi:hypothetical protein
LTPFFVKASLFLLLSLCLAVSLRAQSSQYSPDQLDQMLGPVALYPDPLIALILPASTNPSDIALAAQYLAANGDPSAIDTQPWDPSVRGLAHYPDVLDWMNSNLDWTRALGAAFAVQPADVMKSVQQLRAKARAAGTLVNSPQQQVDVEGDDIRIVPTQPGTIFVPQYDADDVYDVPDGYSGPFISYGIGYPVGPWLGYECNWDDFGIWVGPWHPGWGYRRDWRDARYGGSRWHPDAFRGRALVRNFYRPGGELPSPRVIAGARVQVRGGGVDFHGSVRASGPVSHGSVTITHSAPDYRGYEGPRPSSPAPSGQLFGGYSRGSQVRDYSSRGNESRQSPVRRSSPERSAPQGREAPERSSSPGSRDRPH